MTRRDKRTLRTPVTPVPVEAPARAEPPPVPFDASDDERLIARVHLRTRKALVGTITPKDVRLCLFGAALLAVEAGLEAEKIFAAFREEHERVSREFDAWKLGEPEQLRAEVGLPKDAK